MRFINLSAGFWTWPDDLRSRRFCGSFQPRCLTTFCLITKSKSVSLLREGRKSFHFWVAVLCPNWNHRRSFLGLISVLGQRGLIKSWFVGKSAYWTECLVNGLSTKIIKFDFGTNKITFSHIFFAYLKETYKSVFPAKKTNLLRISSSLPSILTKSVGMWMTKK